MKTAVALLSAVALLAACKPRELPAPPPVVPQAASSRETVREAPRPAASAATPAPISGGGGTAIVMGDANLPELNRALKAYIAKFNKPPQSLNDLEKEGLIKFIPFAPPGMRYELDATRREVKLVNSMVK
ncbi:MAG: hypothetical protein HY300_06945 [Verrucomicrobia bacterium]|nr:hypothetical protein [Verrucomicrobiota bacterium]